MGSRARGVDAAYQGEKRARRIGGDAAINYATDANVFIALARTEETHQAVSLDLPDQSQSQQPSVFCASVDPGEIGISKRTPTNQNERHYLH
jgi:hypothetical protein